MRQLSVLIILFLVTITATVAFAVKETVALKVNNMSCISCPYMVKKTLSDLSGVSAVDVSFETKIATVTFDDDLTNAKKLTEATANAGYPSKVIKKGE